MRLALLAVSSVTDQKLIKMLVEKPEGNIQFGRPMLRWEGNITLDLRRKVKECLNCINLVQDSTSGWLL
jgi:hypothetical protein